MSITSRDRKILAALLVLGIVVGYWFLVVKPKRADIKKLGTQISKKEQELGGFKQAINESTLLKTTYAADYATMVRLGRGITDETAIPSLLVELDALTGSSVDFTEIEIEKYPAPLLAASTTPVVPFQGLPGEAELASLASSSSTESDAAGDTAGSASGDSKGSGSSGSSATPTSGKGQSGSASSGGAGSSSSATTGSTGSTGSTSSSSTTGSTSASSGSGTGSAGTEQTTATTVSAESLNFQPIRVRLQFQGNFFKIHQLFEDIEDLVQFDVRQAGVDLSKALEVDGRLIFIEGLRFKAGREAFPKIAGNVGVVVFAQPSDAATQSAGAPTVPSDSDSSATPVSSGGSGATGTTADK